MPNGTEAMLRPHPTVAGLQTRRWNFDVLHVVKTEMDRRIAPNPCARCAPAAAVVKTGRPTPVVPIASSRACVHADAVA